MKSSALSRIRSFINRELFQPPEGQSSSSKESMKSNLPTKETIAAILNDQKSGDVPMSERAAYTPKEFAALFGKSYVWGYRQIYAGKVKVITDMGRMLISREEVDRIRGRGTIYTGKKIVT